MNIRIANGNLNTGIWIPNVVKHAQCSWKNMLPMSGERDENMQQIYLGTNVVGLVLVEEDMMSVECKET